MQEQRRRLEELQQLPGKQAPQAPTQPSEDSRCFQIERIDLQGATLLSEGNVMPCWRIMKASACRLPGSMGCSSGLPTTTSTVAT